MATVTLFQGKLKGSKCNTDKGTEYFEFLGIPYAKPPIGDLRFKSPQPPEKWHGIRDSTAISESQVSCQLDIVKHHYIGSEDCLYLNVYTPKLSNSNEEAQRPVMFSLHGGGFLFGNGVMKTEAGPDFLIDNNAVIVSINYRLGIFGFLSLDIPEVAGNMGLKDQVQALIWVQNNIHKFGGDKGNVTIFGVSAGSASGEFHILSSKSKGLFHKVILQSGSSLNHWAINFEPHKMLDKLLEKVGYKGSIQCRRSCYEYLLTCPAQVLTEASFKTVEESKAERVFFGYVPIIEKDYGNDEAFLTTNPYRLLKEGSFNKVPVIKGFCEKEGYMMELEKASVIEDLNKNKKFLHHWAYSLVTKDRVIYESQFANIYNKNQAVDFFGDYDFISGIWVSGQMMANHGVPVYFYKFSYEGKINFFKNVFNVLKEGAAHADDVTYIFKHDISKLADKSDVILRDKMTKMWTNFAKTSNPVTMSCSELPMWPAYNRSSPLYLNIDKVFTIETNYETAKIAIFKEIYDKYQM